MEETAIKPYHVFHHERGSYLINIEDMTANSINKTESQALQTILAHPSAMLERGMEEDMKKLGLLSEGKKKTSGADRKPQPITNLCLFLTQSCNLNCVYCYGDGGTYGVGGDMEKETAYQSIDWLIQQSEKMKQIQVGFFGGEPFLKFSLMKAIVQYAKKRAEEVGKTTSFHATSNATLFDDEVIAFIKEEKLRVLVSFDGPKEIQDAQRPYANGEGTYDATLPKIKKLLAADPKTPGHAVLVGDTDPKLVKDTLQEIGFTEYSILPASQSLFTDNETKAKRERDTEELVQEIEREANTWVEGLQRRDVEALKELKNKSELYPAILSLLHNSKRRYGCGAGLGLVAVSSVGDVYLCHRFVGQEEYKLGTIFEDHLNRKQYQESPTISNTTCSVCFARYYCGGGCKHDHAGSCGSIASPAEDLCHIRCRELELAAMIVSNLSQEDRGFFVDQDVFPPKPCPLDF